ncbi:OmpH family outer membrane protein [Chryseosolibacter indicus]|uniref:OmpH family outer membrane protein n=1 Tax=Chryseosolibacter indicus TaxID=2782351 RepID=A0ABS5VYT6_9BACT|nr:OmpH family outer membrane protein [Chryseosolibacter indicus]MBT1706012.1 OmpH family outer membrane protein [Chryseosolibacter indicus]
MRKFALLFVLGVTSFFSHAQTASKVGFADVDYIFSQMPESKQIETELKSTQTQLKNQIDGKAQEFQKKLQDYQANAGTMLDAVRVNTERELQQLQQNLEKLQQDAQSTIQNKQVQLMDPVYKKVSKAIEDVSKEQGYTLVLNSVIGGVDAVLYGDSSHDVSDLVLKKLGVTPKPAAANTQAPATTPPPANNKPKQ